MNEQRHIATDRDVTRPRYVRAVKAGVIPGWWDTVAQLWTPMPTGEAASVPCPECWAGLSHSGPGWARHQAAG